MELSRLMGIEVNEIQQNRARWAWEASREFDCIVLLKGHETVIAIPSGKIFINHTGNSALAKAGSGDVLTGMIAGFCAQGISLEEAACAAVYIHGIASEIASKSMTEYCVLASDLIKYIPKKKIRYTTDFADDILSVEWEDSSLDNDVLKNYKAKAEHYIRQHQQETAIAKLKGNKPLTETDVSALERILWSDVGSKDEYEAVYGQKPLGEFVREIVGLDMRAAKEAFAEYLNETKFDSRQIYFVNQVVEYIVRNGLMKDLTVLQEPPFTDYGSIVDIFQDVNVWFNIRGIIEQINANAKVA